jgi:transglutaminase-like putative cysteine protease
VKFLARVFILSLFFFCLLRLSSGNINAQGEFQTDYSVTYSVEPSGRTNVTQDIVLKNKTANFYADKFELKIGSTKVENVKAQDGSGPMEVEVKFEDNVTSIAVKFNQRVIGIDKTLPWSLTYSSGELATKSGQIWEISIPKVADSPDIGLYTATVSVPPGFGPVAFAVPTPQATSTSARTQEYTFEKSQLTQSGIAMSFGEKQIFSFNLSYYLENKNLTSRFEEITLPPDNNYQKVVLENIQPQPQDVYVDPDGNFIARYKLAPKARIDISANGYVEVFSKPFRNIYPKLTDAQKEQYTQPQRYWETDSAFIKNKANELKTPEKIYEFVTNYLTYSNERLNSQKVERKGAASAVDSPEESICMEFTDLFIAIARSAKIPAREVEGYAYTQNERLRPLSLDQEGDILHAWPEYWDENLGWVQVDPTWGSTSGGLDYFNKLDFNHVTFIQRGVSSTNPYPAGAFKREDELSAKGVFVAFAQELPQATVVPQLELLVPDKIIAGVPVKVLARLKNAGSTSLVSGTLNLATNLKIKGESSVAFAVLPPFAQRTEEFTLQTKGFFTKSTEPISLSFGDKFITESVSVIPVYYLLISPNFLAGTGVALAIAFAGFYLYRRFHHVKPPNPKLV